MFADYQTHAIRQEPDRLIRTVCEDIGCEAYDRGWITRIDESTSLGRAQAHYVRYQSGRTFHEQRDGALAVFTFESGQRCFAEHRTQPTHFRLYAGEKEIPRPQRRVLRESMAPTEWIDTLVGNTERLAGQG